MTTVNKNEIPAVETKGKISDVISAYKRAYEKEQKKVKQISVSFYKGDIKHIFERKSDNRKMAIIAFPKDSIYFGYVFFYPAQWIYKNEKANPQYSSNPDRRWIYITNDYLADIFLSDKDKTGKFYVKDKKTLTALELKEGMKRKRRENK